MAEKKDDKVGQGSAEAAQRSEAVPQHKRLAQGVPGTGVRPGTPVKQKF
jgi:hypothetical protein